MCYWEPVWFPLTFMSYYLFFSNIFCIFALRNFKEQIMSRQHHYLGILPQYYRAIEQGKKTFEVREKRDRNFQEYDILHLLEELGGERSGREIIAEVTYVLDDPRFCKEGFVVMGIRVETINN